MIYLDNGATSFHKPPAVYRAVLDAMYSCANPGRGGYAAAGKAAHEPIGNFGKLVGRISYKLDI